MCVSRRVHCCSLAFSAAGGPMLQAKHLSPTIALRMRTLFYLAHMHQTYEVPAELFGLNIPEA